MLDFKPDYSVWESVIHLRADGNTCILLHVACKPHAVIKSHLGAFFLPFSGNFYKFEEWKATCIVQQLHCILPIQKMQVDLFPFSIVYLPIEFGSKIVLRRSAVWHFWCHCFAWSCMHHTTMPCTCFAYWCVEVIIPLILSTHHPWIFSVFYVLHLPVFGNSGILETAFLS